MTTIAFSQQWLTTGNNATPADFLGTTNAQHLKIRTANLDRAWVTTGNFLSGTLGSAGDGITIMPKMTGCPIPSTSAASLDMWTSCSNGTNIRWGLSGEISGAMSQFQQLANYNGFWFNASGTGGSPRYIFNTTGTEQGRIGLNRFWRIGDNPSGPAGIDAVRRLEVFDNSNAPQFRLTANQASATFTDFLARPNGSLNILPSGAGRVAINLNANPSHNLEVNGDMRVRNIPVATPNCLLVGTNQAGPNDNQVSRLDFTGNANQVLLGNGTWGTAPSGLGNYCANPLNSLTGNYQISLNQNDFFFSDFNNNPNTNRVAIGLNCTPFLVAKLTVNQNNTVLVSQNTTAIRSVNINNADPSASNLIFRSVWGEASGGDINKNLRIGGDFRAITNTGTGYNYGVRGVAENMPINTISPVFHIGGLFIAQSNLGVNNDIAIGVAGFASGGGLSNIGVYGEAPDLNTNLGPNYAGYFNGDLLYTMQFGASDAMFKTNVNTVNNALSIISDLQPKTYNYDVTAFQGKMNFKNGIQYGFIAQDVEQILPELVGTAVQPGKQDSLGNIIYSEFQYKTLNYNGLFAILTKGIQEQQSMIDSLENLISTQDSINNALYSMITSCCSSNSNLPQNNSINPNQNGNNTMDITLTDNIPNIVLDQNVPNPFAEQTTITYKLTEGVQKAQMLFYNIEGKLIQSVDLSSAAGQGQINVFANDLSTGVYTYS